MKLMVLLSTYNGEKYIEEQLNSIFNQTYGDVSILVRDDGSTDGTIEILEKYAHQGKLNWNSGENIGCAKSFWHLICCCEKADYYAFCDQDDVWDNDKLEVAVNMLEKEDNSIPLLYFSDVRVTDRNLNVISSNMVEIMPISYPHSLIKNISPGCTYVFNNKARELLLKYDCQKHGIDIHDWTVYKVVACFGKVIFDRKAHMSYRQHGNNVIGASRNGLDYFIRKVKNFFDGKSTNLRELNAIRMEQCYGDLMSDVNLQATKLMAHYRENKNTKLELIRSRLFKFKGIKYLYFKLLIILNKL